MRLSQFQMTCFTVFIYIHTHQIVSKFFTRRIWLPCLHKGIRCWNSEMQTVTNWAKKKCNTSQFPHCRSSFRKSSVLEFCAIMTSKCHLSAVITIVSIEEPSLHKTSSKVESHRLVLWKTPPKYSLWFSDRDGECVFLGACLSALFSIFYNASQLF